MDKPVIGVENFGEEVKIFHTSLKISECTISRLFWPPISTADEYLSLKEIGGKGAGIIKSLCDLNGVLMIEISEYSLRITAEPDKWYSVQPAALNILERLKATEIGGSRRTERNFVDKTFALFKQLFSGEGDKDANFGKNEQKKPGKASGQ